MDDWDGSVARARQAEAAREAEGYRATLAHRPAWWEGKPLPVIEAVSNLMRTIDAYAFDYAKDGKLAASRRSVERELVEVLSRGVLGTLKEADRG